jgi:hypothetical protein
VLNKSSSLLTRYGSHYHEINAAQASVAGIAGSLAAPLYCATKHAIVGFVKSLATSEPLTGVKITTLCPGAVMTPLFDASKTKQFSLTPETALTPEACAMHLLELLQKKEYPCGSVLEFTLAGTRLIPEWGIEPPKGSGSGQDHDEVFIANMMQPINDTLNAEKAKS